MSILKTRTNHRVQAAPKQPSEATVQIGAELTVYMGAMCYAVEEPLRELARISAQYPDHFRPAYRQALREAKIGMDALRQYHAKVSHSGDDKIRETGLGFYDLFKAVMEAPLERRDTLYGMLVGAGQMTDTEWQHFVDNNL